MSAAQNQPPVDTTTESTPEAAPERHPARDAARLAGQLLLLLLASLTTLSVFVLFVPEVNDYHLASKLKHERLVALASPKIVLAGGSNLAFGIDSPSIEKETGRPVVNMGMDGYLGVEFILSEVEPHLKPSDLVVVALEHDGYVIPVEGVPENQFAVLKANPGATRYLTDAQRIAVLQSFEVIAQAKVTRLLKDGLQSVQHLLSGVQDPWQLAEHVRGFQGFNSRGDLTSHLDIEFPERPAEGMNLAERAFDPVTKVLQDFNERMHRKGVDVLFSYPPVADNYYERYKGPIDRIHEALTADPAVRAPSPPSAFVIPEALFFDTVYHVNRKGREIRTRKLVSDIKGLLADQL